MKITKDTLKKELTQKYELDKALEKIAVKQAKNHLK